MSETKRETCWCCGEVHEETDRAKIARLEKSNEALAASLYDVTDRLADRMQADLEPARPRKLTAVVRDVFRPGSLIGEDECVLKWLDESGGKTFPIRKRAPSCDKYEYRVDDADGLYLRAEWLEPGSIREEWVPQKGEAVWGQTGYETSWLGIYEEPASTGQHKLHTRGRGIEPKQYGWAAEIRPIEEASDPVLTMERQAGESMRRKLDAELLQED